MAAAVLGPGWSCWDVGGGDGSVARLLYEIVGLTGHVTVSDIDLRYMDDLPHGIRKLTHDIAAQQPPAAFFDLVHARLLLAHLAGRYEALRSMVSVLRPGGVVVVQDWGAYGRGLLLHPTDLDTVDLFDRFQFAVGQPFTEAGNDGQWCTRTYAAMVDLGLERVSTQVACRSWHGGTTAAQVNIAVADELFEVLVSGGHLTEEDILNVQKLLSDPQTVFTGHATWTTIGYRPGGAR
jgi:SAM-dependent methyltransferase